MSNQEQKSDIPRGRDVRTTKEGIEQREKARRKLNPTDKASSAHIVIQRITSLFTSHDKDRGLTFRPRIDTLNRMPSDQTYESDEEGEEVTEKHTSALLPEFTRDNESGEIRVENRDEDFFSDFYASVGPVVQRFGRDTQGVVKNWTWCNELFTIPQRHGEVLPAAMRAFILQIDTSHIFIGYQGTPESTGDKKPRLEDTSMETLQIAVVETKNVVDFTDPEQRVSLLRTAFLLMQENESEPTPVLSLPLPLHDIAHAPLVPQHIEELLYQLPYYFPQLRTKYITTPPLKPMDEMKKRHAEEKAMSDLIGRLKLKRIAAYLYRVDSYEDGEILDGIPLFI